MNQYEIKDIQQNAKMELRIIRDFIKDNYKEMYQKWAIYSQEFFTPMIKFYTTYHEKRSI